jgi:hypothetical protein
MVRYYSLLCWNTVANICNLSLGRRNGHDHYRGHRLRRVVDPNLHFDHIKLGRTGLDCGQCSHHHSRTRLSNNLCDSNPNPRYNVYQ